MFQKNASDANILANKNVNSYEFPEFRMPKRRAPDMRLVLLLDIKKIV